MDLVWIVGTAVALIGGICLLPGGAALLIGMLEPRVGRAIIAAGAGIVALLAVRRNGYQAGKSDALADVAKANADAVQRHQVIERDVADTSEAELRDHLRSWSQ